MAAGTDSGDPGIGVDFDAETGKCGFGFGGLENGNASIGVPPSGEEFLVSGFGVRMTALPQCDLCLLQAGPESAQIAPYNGKVGPAAGRQLDRWLPGFHRSPWPW